MPGARVWSEGDSRIVKVAEGAVTSTDLNGAFELEVATGKALLVAAAPNEGRVEGPQLTVSALSSVLLPWRLPAIGGTRVART